MLLALKRWCPLAVFNLTAAVVLLCPVTAATAGTTTETSVITATFSATVTNKIECTILNSPVVSFGDMNANDRLDYQRGFEVITNCDDGQAFGIAPGTLSGDMAIPLTKEKARIKLYNNSTCTGAATAFWGTDNPTQSVGSGTDVTLRFCAKVTLDPGAAGDINVVVPITMEID